MKSKLDVLKANNPILEIQFKLKDISQAEPDIPMVFPTGKYDEQTKIAVIEFQKKSKLPVTGEVDFTTWNKLNEEHKISAHYINEPKTLCCFPSKMQEYKLGDKDSAIYALQIILKYYHKKYKNHPDVNLTGIFDKQTEEALRQFQKHSHLPVTGILDRRTWNTLNQINEICKLYE